jgi:hypothetical protein
MATVMALIAGDGREILLAVAVEDWDGLADRSRFRAYLSLGGGLDPTWLDLFSEAVRSVTGGEQPRDFIDARRELDGTADVGERTIERVDPEWVTAIARLPDRDVDAVAGRWIDLVEDDLGELAPDEKPWIRGLVGDIVAFARDADTAPDVLFAWSI